MVFSQRLPGHFRVLILGALCLTQARAYEGATSDTETDRIVQGSFVGYIKTPGALLGVDEARILNASADAESSALSRARVFAAQRLLAYSLREVKWPPLLASDVTTGLSNSFLRVHQFNAKLQGLQLLKWFKNDESSIRVIVSLPTPEKQIPAISMLDVRRDFAAALVNSPDELDVPAYLEFCEKSEIPRVVQLLVQRMRQYGEGTAVTLAGGAFASTTNFQMTSSAEAEPAIPSNRVEGLRLLGTRPYDPGVCLALGDLMRKSGHVRMAQLVYSRGASVFVNRAKAVECKNKIEMLVWPSALSYPHPELPPSLIASIWKTNGTEAEQLPRACRLVVEAAGHLPVQVSTIRNEMYDDAWRWFASSPPNLTNALQRAVQALDAAFTADTVNLIGRILMLQGNHSLAIPFLEQARFLDSEHPYAQGNLALALYAVGEKQTAKRIALQAAACPRTPNNLKNELESLVYQN